MKKRISIPLMPLPYKAVKPMIKGFYPLAEKILIFMPQVERDLQQTENLMDAKEYAAGALFTFTIYLIFFWFISIVSVYRLDMFTSVHARAIAILVPLVVAILLFFYILLIPKWIASKKTEEFDRNLLFATRHLMVQTSAGVPLFDSIVSISEQYGNIDIDYGEISKEFDKIVKEVKSGKEFTQALEDSASRNPSQHYRRIMWQLANANKSGSNVGTVLKTIVEFLSDEQRIAIRNYGSQLNPLSLFYMLMCIIAPTMGLVLLIVASTFVDVPINEFVLGGIAVVLFIAQVMFIGLIKSRRPKVAL